MNKMEMLKADNPVKICHGLSKTLLGADIVASGKNMAGIQAHAGPGRPVEAIWKASRTVCWLPQSRPAARILKARQVLGVWRITSHILVRSSARYCSSLALSTPETRALQVNQDGRYSQ